MTDKYKLDFSIGGIKELAKLKIELIQTNKKLREHTKLVQNQSGASASATSRMAKLIKEHAKLKQATTAGDAALKQHTIGLDKNTSATVSNTTAKKKSAKASKSSVVALRGMAMNAMAVVAAVKTLTSTIGGSVKAFAEFEKGLINVTTLMDKGDIVFFKEKLANSMAKAMRNYGFEVKDVSKALFNAVSAGVKASEASEFLATASVLAKAGVTDLKSATLGLTTVINAYGLETSDATRVAEIFFSTQRKGVTTVEELSKSIGVVVPFASQAGISFEELGASMAVTTRSGLDAAKSVTALRAMIAQMLKPSEEAKDLFTKWKIPIGGAAMAMEGWTGIIEKLSVAYKSNSRDVETMFGNIRGLTAVLSIAGENVDDYNKFLKLNVEDTGKASSMQKAHSDNLDTTAVKLDKMASSWALLKTSWGDSGLWRFLLDESTKLTDIWGASDLSWFEKFSALVPNVSNDLLLLKNTSQQIAREAIEASERLDKAYKGTYSPIIAEGTGINDLIPKFKAGETLSDEDQVRVESFLDDVEISGQNHRYMEFLDAYVKFLSDKQALVDKAAESDKKETKRKVLERQEYNDAEYRLRLSRVQRLADVAKGGTYDFGDGTERAKTTSQIKLEMTNLEIADLEVLRGMIGATGDEVSELAEKLAKLRVKQKTLTDSTITEMLKGKFAEIKQMARDQIKVEEDAYKAKITKENSSYATELLEAKTEGLTADVKLSRDAKRKEINEEIEHIKNLMQIKGRGQSDANIAILKGRLNNAKFALKKFNFDAAQGDIEDAAEAKKKKKAKAEIDSTKEYRDAIAKLNSEYAKKRLEIRKRGLSDDLAVVNQANLDELNLAITHSEDLLAVEGATSSQTSQIDKKLAKAKFELFESEFEKEQANEAAKLDLKRQAATAGFDILNQIANRAAENDVRRSNEELANLDEKKSKGLMSERRYQRAKEKIEKEAFKKRKQNEMKAATISFAQQLMSIQVNAAANPTNAVTFGAAGISQAAALTILAGATYATNMGMIASQKFARGGMVEGNSHSNGGVKFSVGGQVNELEGGEAVINKRSTAMFGGALSAMNVAGGGKSFSSPNLGSSPFIDYGALASAISENISVVLPVESLNKVQNRVRVIEETSKF